MSVNQHVWQAIQKDPAVLQGLQRKLINIRALAKQLITEQGINGSLDSVISSIRRFPLDKTRADEQTLRNIFKDSIISTTNNVACITIPRPLSAVLDKLNTPVMRITSGIDTVKLITENRHAAAIKKNFKNATIEKNLSEISVTVSPQAVKTKGVLARITSELALANINIHEILVCPPQFLIYVSQSNIVKAHERIISLAS